MLVSSRVMQMPRYSRIRDIVGSEYRFRDEDLCEVPLKNN